MGTQQLLLIIIGVIIVGIGVVIAIGIFGSGHEQANRDAMAIDCMRLAIGAKGYYHKPHFLGGGECSFIGVTFPLCGWKYAYNDNGQYSFSSIAQNQLTIQGVGTSGTIVHVTVFPDSICEPVFTTN